MSNSNITQNNSKFDIKDIPIGKCYKCNKKQDKPAEGGLWLTSHKGEPWCCYECKEKYELHSYPLECEWCTYSDVKWCQGHTYDCPRCKYLKIGQAKFYSQFENKN